MRADLEGVAGKSEFAISAKLLPISCLLAATPCYLVDGTSAVVSTTSRLPYQRMLEISSTIQDALDIYRGAGRTVEDKIFLKSLDLPNP